MTDSTDKTLVVQIPAYNEAPTIGGTIADVPRVVPGFSRVLILVIDDGSTDETSRAAEDAGADKVVRFARNRGLALAFQKGLETSLAMGADVVVNFDGDNQYPGDRIPDLAAPVLKGEADMVLGERDFARIPHFTRTKVFLQKFGTRVVSSLAGVKIGDATTGFRAFSRETALSLYVASMFTYTLETIFFAGARKLSVDSVTIVTNPKLRESRLFGSSLEYVLKSMVTILRTSIRYRAFAILTWLSLPLFLAGFFAVGRFLLYHFLWEPGGTGHVQSLVLAGVLLIVSFLLVAIGFLADAVGTNRRLLEELFTLMRKR
jgi:glycosyltransferase involved in cell wall biosynthesis